MKINSVRAAALTDPTALGRTSQQAAVWHDDIDHMNPLADDERYRGQARRFEPPWGEAICVVTADDGTFGVGMTSLAGLTAPLINDFLAPMIVGDDAAEVERLWEMMTSACAAHLGTSGGVSHAISAVDLALWDLRGKTEGQPVYELLGGGPGQPIPCYATGLDVEGYVELGFRAFKLACPWGPDPVEAIGRTIELVGSVRERIGAEADLMLDCWAVNEVAHAVAIAEAMEPFNLGWIEDCIVPEDWPGYAEVRALTPGTMLAAGERWYTDRPFEQAILEGWVDIVQPDPLWVGGATPTRKIAELADRYGVALSVHCGANDSFGQHLAYGLANNTWAEMYIGSARGASLMDSYRATPGMSLPVNGEIVPSDAPGFGIELTLSDIERACS
ncbi:MAG: enolase C-terminal domain-like protein [Acidimicrobiales bacterium]|jgi:L-rhamnonate dehydratase